MCSDAVPAGWLRRKRGDAVEGCFALATGTNDKELFIIEGARHIETYFKQPYVKRETEKLLALFGEKL